MHLHVLAGCGALLRPEPVPAAQIETLIDPRTHTVTAFWFARDYGPGYHDFLLEPVRDTRIAVFAQSLRENFGTRAAPLLLLPDLLDARPPKVPRRAPRAVLREIWSHRPAAGLVLHAITLPEGIDGGDGWAREAGLLATTAQDRLTALRAAFAEEADAAADAISVAVIEPRPEDPGFAALLCNAVAHQVVAQAAPHLAEAGLTADPAALAAAAARLLAAWQADGLNPARPLGSDALARLVARILQALLVRGEAR